MQTLSEKIDARTMVTSRKVGGDFVNANIGMMAIYFNSGR
jgi:hypothetical protein